MVSDRFCCNRRFLLLGSFLRKNEKSVFLVSAASKLEMLLISKNSECMCLFFLASFDPFLLYCIE